MFVMPKVGDKVTVNCGSVMFQPAQVVKVAKSGKTMWIRENVTTPATDENGMRERRYRMPQRDTSHFPQLIRDRYKNIKKTILGDYIILDCYTDEECSSTYYVKVIFHRGTAIYYGDMGTYVFRGNIQKATRFFSWKVNLPYWQEKLEASSFPPINEDVDLDELKEAILQELKDNEAELETEDEDGEEVESDLLREIDYLFSLDFSENHIVVYDRIYQRLKDYWPFTDFWETLSYLVNRCRHTDVNFIYCCELLHYLAAEILTDKDREI